MSCVLIDVKFGFLIRRAKLEPTVLNSQFVTCCRSSIFVMLRLSLPLASMCSLLSSYVCDLLALCFVLVCSPPPSCIPVFPLLLQPNKDGVQL